MNYYRRELPIKDLIKMKESSGMLQVNPKYQRGSAWTDFQRKMFIDSILRGYPIPVIFLHQKEEITKDPMEGKTETKTTYEIIDGQQRINALYRYVKKAYKLVDPANKREAGFASFSQEKLMPWAGKKFEELDKEYQNKLLDTEISFINITYSQNSANEARDLFIRLQAGSALNDQEKRDAWPGKFTAFIFEVGGKYGIVENPGHEFFSEVMKLKIQSSTDRGKVRKIAAQMYQLHSSFSENKRFSSINKEELDELYRNNIDFDKEGERAKKLINCLKVILINCHNCLFSDNRKRIEKLSFPHQSFIYLAQLSLIAD